MNLLNSLKYEIKTGNVILKLIFWNIIFFIIPIIIFKGLNLLGINLDYLYFFSLSSSISALKYKFWTLFSYIFFHYSFVQLFFNMLMLYFVGRLFLLFFNQKQLINLYIVSGVFVALIFLATYNFFPWLHKKEVFLSGSSASTMALLLATTMYAPNMKLDFLLFGSIKLWHITVIFVILNIITGPNNNTSGIIAILAGSFYGYLYVQQLGQGRDICNWFSFFSNFLYPTKKDKLKKVYKNPNKSSPRKISKIVIKSKSQQKIDEILDKISKSGYESLTEDEKQFLFSQKSDDLK